MEGLAEMEVGGGTALVTPVPNLPEFKICNVSESVCERTEHVGNKKVRYLLYLGGGGTRSAFGRSESSGSGTLRGRGQRLWLHW